MQKSDCGDFGVSAQEKNPLNSCAYLVYGLVTELFR